jgi:peptide/nickel transport system substrate-binding protein
VQPLPYDPAQARRLFAEAGWEDRDGDGFLDRQGRRFRIELSTNSESPIRKDAILLMQEQLRRAGVEATPRFFEYSTLAQRNAQGEFDGTLQAFVMDTRSTFTPSPRADQNWGG